jgi:hypothetical protein
MKGIAGEVTCVVDCAGKGNTESLQLTRSRLLYKGVVRPGSYLTLRSLTKMVMHQADWVVKESKQRTSLAKEWKECECLTTSLFQQ